MRRSASASGSESMETPEKRASLNTAGEVPGCAPSSFNTTFSRLSARWWWPSIARTQVRTQSKRVAGVCVCYGPTGRGTRTGH
eukprot:3188451-Prymnesium_polylepis.1